MRLVGKLLRLPQLARYVVAMQRVYREAGQGDWTKVAAEIEQMHQRHLVTNTSRHWLGLAYLKLQRWNEALEQYDAIDGPLKDPDADAHRIINHALSHYRIGNTDICARLLKQGMTEEWPDAELRKAKEILSEIEYPH